MEPTSLNKCGHDIFTITNKNEIQRVALSRPIFIGGAAGQVFKGCSQFIFVIINDIILGIEPIEINVMIICSGARNGRKKREKLGFFLRNQTNFNQLRSLITIGINKPGNRCPGGNWISETQYLEMLINFPVARFGKHGMVYVGRFEGGEIVMVYPLVHKIIRFGVTIFNSDPDRLDVI